MKAPMRAANCGPGVLSDVRRGITRGESESLMRTARLKLLGFELMISGAEREGGRKGDWRIRGRKNKERRSRKDDDRRRKRDEDEGG